MIKLSERVLAAAIAFGLLAAIGCNNDDPVETCPQGESVLLREDMLFRPGGGGVHLFTFKVSAETAAAYEKGDLVPWEALELVE